MGYMGRTEPCRGALTLEQALDRGRVGHSHIGMCYVVKAPLGGYYTSSIKRLSKKVDGVVIAAFLRDGTEVPV